jgi:hypothetical protein
MVELLYTDDYGTMYAAPVTLRQVEAAGVRLDSAFGMDGAEHASLLDDPSILRLVFGVEYIEDYGLTDITRIECFSAALAYPADWQECFYWERRHTSENANRIVNRRNIMALEGLLDAAVPEARTLMDKARKSLAVHLGDDQV